MLRTLWVIALVLPVVVPAIVMAAPAGRIEDAGLRAQVSEDGDITLSWTASCLATDTDYEIYEGVLGDLTSHLPVSCSTSGATTWTFAPAAGDTYYVVVPRNDTREGSYGTDSLIAERPQSGAACLAQETGVCPTAAMLVDIDSGQPSPVGNYRWLDAADQVYSTGYRDDYDYTQATVQVRFFTGEATFHGDLIADNLKPHFAYQVKIVGIPGTPSNEGIGLAGRWWQEEWNGSQWTGGQNLNNKGDGSSPNPNDDAYFARRDIPDPTSPTGLRYRYTAYLVFDYFITDEYGGASVFFQADSSYHVLWKISQRGHTASDGPIRTASFDVELPDPVSAYDVNYPPASVSVFGEWERLPVGGVTLPPGSYEADFILTEESFHGSGLAGGWAAAMSAPVSFEVVSSSSR